MRIPLDEVVHFDAVTHHPTTGAVTDADSTPTFSVFEEDTDTAIVGPSNLTKRTALTGNYRGSFTASAANGFEVGKWYNVVASATVNSIAGKAVVLTFTLVPAEALAGVPKVDVGGWLGTAPATPATAGVPSVANITQEGVKKNTALANFMFPMVDEIDHASPMTGLTITATRSLDGAAFAACANAASEVASGFYKINLANTDLNADVVTLRFTATGADATTITIKTSP